MTDKRQAGSTSFRNIERSYAGSSPAIPQTGGSASMLLCPAARSRNLSCFISKKPIFAVKRFAYQLDDPNQELSRGDQVNSWCFIIPHVDVLASIAAGELIDVMIVFVEPRCRGTHSV